MKKFIAILLALSIILPCCYFACDDKLFVTEREITQQEATDFSNSVKQVCAEKSYSSEHRLLVRAQKNIEDEDAVDIIEGVDNLYVLQYDSKEAADNALARFEECDYVDSVESDCGVYSICDAESDEPFDFDVECPSTVQSNIDDAIKLAYSEGCEFEEMLVGIIDTGIALNSVTMSRFAGGYSYMHGFLSDGTQDYLGHGTKIAGTMIHNTPDNVMLYSYQIFGKKPSAQNTSEIIAAIYQATADGCKVINCSFSGENSDAAERAVDYAVEHGCVVVSSAGNNGNQEIEFPANHCNTISVGAVTRDGKRATYSNYGDGVDIYAMGSNLMSLSTLGVFTGDIWSGTSASAPVVSAIVTTLLCVKPDISTQEIKSLLVETGTCLWSAGSRRKTELIADAYGCVMELTNSELPRVQLTYMVKKNPESDYSDVTLTSEEGARIYGYAGNDFYQPFDSSVLDIFSDVASGEVKCFDKYCTAKALAYAPGKAKSKYQFFQAPVDLKSGGYRLEGGLSKAKKTTVSRCYLGHTVINVPEYIDGYRVEKIGAYCFMGNTFVEEIVLPDSVTEIGELAFANCPNLKKVIAPKVENCSYMAFYECDNLKYVSMPQLEEAQTGLFKNCSQLRTADLGELNSICNQAFYGCDKLRYLKVSDMVTSFSSNTFNACDELTVNTYDNSYMYDYCNEQGINLGNLEECEHNNLRVASELIETCYSNGYTCYVCIDCGYSYTEYRDAHGHQYDKTVIEPTCLNIGYNLYTCRYCNDKYISDYNYNYLSHNYVDESVVLPTTLKIGYKIQKCEFCNSENYLVICPLYDFNEDYYVNAKDFAMLSRNVKQYENDPDNSYDLNGDGVLDELDVEMFTEAIGNFELDEFMY